MKIWSWNINLTEREHDWASVNKVCCVCYYFLDFVSSQRVKGTMSTLVVLKLYSFVHETYSAKLFSVNDISAITLLFKKMISLNEIVVKRFWRTQYLFLVPTHLYISENWNIHVVLLFITKTSHICTCCLSPSQSESRIEDFFSSTLI